jgi:hypothetical protein
MNAPQSNLISRTGVECRELLARDGTYIQLDILNTAYALLITKEEIDSVPSFAAAGLTLAQYQAAVYILKQCHIALNSDLPAIVALANL